MIATTSHIADEELMAFAESELPQSEAQMVEAHVQDCPVCAERLSAWQQEARPLAEMLQSWGADPVPMRVERTVLGALAAHGKDGRSEKILSRLPGADRWRLWAGAAAALTAVAVLISVLAVHQKPQIRVYTSQHEMEMLTPPAAPAPSAAQRTRAGYSQAERREPQQAAGVAGMSGGVMGGVVGGEPVVAPASAPALAPASAPPPQAVMRAKQAVPQAGGGVQHDLASRTVTSSEPMIARTAALSLTVDNVDRERVVLEGLLGRYGGYAAAMQVNTPVEGPRRLTASLRVPATTLAQALADLRTLGHVEAESQSGEDVGQDHADLQARLNTARSTEDRLRGILREHTGSVSDVLEVEEEIASTREKIESMEAELDGMEHRVSYATIDLQLSETAGRPAARTLGGRLGQSLADGWNNAEELLVSFVLWLAEEGPTIALILLLLGLPAVLLWRRYWREPRR